MTIDVLKGSAIRDVPARHGDHAETADAQTLRWVEAAGLCETPAELRNLARIRPGLLAAWCHPRAGRSDSALVAMWMAWLFLLDDRIDEGDLGRDADRLEEHLHEPLGIVSYGSAPTSPMGRALAEIVERASDAMPDPWVLRFRRHVADYLSACVWQAAHRQAGHVPYPDGFPAWRRAFGAIMPSFDLVERTDGCFLPPSLYYSRPFQDLLVAAADLVCWTNDLMTVDKEAAQGDPHNLVLVTAHHGGMDRHAAALLVTDAFEDRLRAHARARRELTDLTRAFATPPALRRQADHCAEALLDWARGHLEWGLGTPRYRTGTTTTTTAPAPPAPTGEDHHADTP
ncbi:terpene synthase family protein [Kitasatospora sp. NPDC058397]|uniref:(-)-delta-cadinene synthase n=1 Tax=unclassified Kitasatospora TaxID=2633591 RepID=UPI0036529E55